MLQASDAVRTTQPIAGGGELTLVRSASLDRAVMLSKGVPDARAGTTYHDGTATGKFAAVTIAATPTGTRKVNVVAAEVALEGGAQVLAEGDVSGRRGRCCRAPG